jgi:hypothetical protein
MPRMPRMVFIATILVLPADSRIWGVEKHTDHTDHTGNRAADFRNNRQ